MGGREKKTFFTHKKDDTKNLTKLKLTADVPNNSLFTLETTLLSSAWGGAPRTVFFLSPLWNKIDVKKKKGTTRKDNRKKGRKYQKKEFIALDIVPFYHGAQT